MTYSFRTNGNFIDFVHTDNTSLMVESVLRSLHNTSRCVDWSLPEDTTRISFVIDDIRVDNFPLSEIDFDGTAINSQDDFETGIEAAFPGLAGGGSPGAASYLVYTALLTQENTDNPTATVLENTLGGTVVWTRTVAGSYVATLAGAFTENKTVIVPFGTSGIINMMIGSDNPSSFGYSLFRSNVNEIGLSVFDDTYSPAELAPLMAGNANIYIEIRVYP
jgi:hypothetical protein